MEDAMEDMSYSKVALRKLAPVTEGFRIFSAEWLGSAPADWHAMKVTGATFRAAKSGPRAGRNVILVPGTSRFAIVTKEEMQAEEAERPND